MIVGLVMLIVGLLLSAFFSGSETGFYRATRLRLAMNAISGDRVSQWLLWLANNPALFVATTLVGNNVANYSISLAVVLLTKTIIQYDSSTAELVATVMFSPLVFVYGELLPKSLFYKAPNRLLRRGAPLFLLFTVLFIPVSAMLWLIARGMQSMMGEMPLRLRLSLARKELQEVLREGQEIGLLNVGQRTLAQNLFAVAAAPIARHCRPLLPSATVTVGESAEQVLQKARRHRQSVLPVVIASSRELVGYLRVVELRLAGARTVRDYRTMPRCARHESYLAVLTRLQSADEDMAAVVDEQGRTLGVLYTRELAERLLREG